MTQESKQRRNRAVQEYEREPVPESATKGWNSYLGLFASEHVAGTELLIGPLFVVHGVAAFDILVGLLIGNLLAVLSWTFVTAPIAVAKRLTFYYQLEKIGGRYVVTIYNLANGLLWCCLAAAMIYVSATPAGLFFGFRFPELNDTLPSDPGTIVSILVVGGLITFVAVRGYDAMARFANIVAPWMVVVFIAFGLMTFPMLGIKDFASFWEVAQMKVWRGETMPGFAHFTIYHVICFSWFGNLAWHIGMGDLTLFRYAKKARYGLASSAGMYLGHYIAWIAAGLLYAVQLQADPTETAVRPAEMAYGVAGVVGLICVVLAGWTTANPIIYRAGLAFQSLVPKVSRVKITLITGILASVIALFPIVTTRFTEVSALYGLLLMPMGAVIFADFYLVKRLRLKEFYAEYSGKRFYAAPIVAWLVALSLCFMMQKFLKIEIFFLALPGWFLTIIVYLLASRLLQRGDETNPINHQTEEKS